MWKIIFLGHYDEHGIVKDLIIYKERKEVGKNNLVCIKENGPFIGRGHLSLSLHTLRQKNSSPDNLQEKKYLLILELIPQCVALIRINSNIK